MRSSNLVQWTANRHGASVEDVGVDHSSADVLVPQQFLHGADVVAIFQQVGGEGVAEGMGSDVLLDASELSRFADGLLEAALVEVVPAGDPCARVFGKGGGREHILPDPLAVGVGIFACQGIREVDPTVALGQVPLVNELDTLEMLL